MKEGKNNIGNNEAAVDKKQIEKVVIDSIKPSYILDSYKFKRKIVYFDMQKPRKYITLASGKSRERYFFDMFLSPKNQDKQTKTTNINHSRYKYKNCKNQDTIISRNMLFYWNAVKYIVFEYQPEITTFELKIRILKEYVDTLIFYPYKDSQDEKLFKRVLEMQNFTQEIKVMESTKEYKIDYEALSF